ncbi:2Fe-2S iron-sulfur cluster-binding protein [Halosolutus halophilus]|uniref:2Fe-2S iron-sulfur cluster-binding protein n=1 Tax=Halosolutus halophilus TaxID=1552990 RepID=UPI0022352F24|nr:2Fe-2S iron-sulfur cluster-binding protein [Halosolutus halophilus]
MTSHDVTLEWPDGRTRTIAVREDESVLEGGERDGVGLPFGCRTGACGTCVGRLLAIDGTGGGGDAADREPIGDAGDTEPIDVADAFAYRREPRALKPRHRTGGYVLLCIATPRADCRVAVGSQVQSELVDNPWK